MPNNDKYKAIWASYSSIGNYLKCPRLYFLNNVYKDPITGHKINIINPSLALGQIVHETIENISNLSINKRFEGSLLDSFENNWKQVSGELGGFNNKEEEEEFKQRGKDMIQRVMDFPGPLLNKAIKIKGKIIEDLPSYILSEEDNIILCGKIDWLEYLADDDSVHLIDFKTGKHEEDLDSLQLPIYVLLISNLQTRKLSNVSYWYLDRDNEPTQVSIPDVKDSHDKVLKIALQIKEARESKNLSCKKEGCFHCEPFEKIISGQAKLVGSGSYNTDIYIIE
jgi:ATP-dependent helicase/DNAse subunit B